MAMKRKEKETSLADIKVQIIGDVSKVTKGDIINLAVTEFERLNAIAQEEGILPLPRFRSKTRKLKDQTLSQMQEIAKKNHLDNIRFADKTESFIGLVVYMAGDGSKKSGFSMDLNKPTYHKEYELLKKLYAFTLSIWGDDANRVNQCFGNPNAFITARMMKKAIREKLEEVKMDARLEDAVAAWYRSLFANVVIPMPKNPIIRDIFYCKESIHDVVAKLLAFIQEEREKNTERKV